MFLLKTLLAAEILPPTGPVVPSSVAQLSMMALSMPIVGNALLAMLHQDPPLSSARLQLIRAPVNGGGCADA